MRHKGLQAHRLKREPLEALFAKRWQEQNDRGSTLAYLLHTGDQSGRPPDPSPRDVEIAATVIQWLGSPVGQSFLTEIIVSHAGKP